MLPRGSTRVEAGDRLHVVVRSEVAGEMEDVLERWRSGPLVSDAKPPRELVSSPGVFTSRPWNEEEDGSPSHPRELLGLEVRDHLRTRRDTPGALLVLVDGRYAITGPTLAVGGSRQLQAYARRRLARETDETARAWWQEVIGALAR